MSAETHLWEPEHPYYCSEGCYYATGHHHAYPTWAAFVADGDLLYDGDHDLNLLFRWDWQRPNPNDYVDGEEMPRDDSLLLFYVIQRKAFTLSVGIDVVTAADEPLIRAWLTERARTITAIWAPLNLAPTQHDREVRADALDRAAKKLRAMADEVEASGRDDLEERTIVQVTRDDATLLERQAAQIREGGAA